MKEKKFSGKKRTIEKKEFIFQVINTVLVVAILCFYFGRMFYYKAKFDKAFASVSYAALSSVMIERNDLASEDRLYENEDGSYTFKGNVKNNYFMFAGQLFRVIGIDVDGNIKAISQNPVSIAILSGETHFEKTALAQWLAKDVYCQTLARHGSMLSAGNFNFSIIEDVKSIPTDYVVSQSYGLLTLDEYIAAGGQNSYLNFSDAYWLGSSDANGSFYFVDDKGSVGTSFSETLLLNVRPVIYLSYTVKALAGDGTVEQPYILTENPVATIADLPSGSYFVYQDLLFRACYKNEDGSLRAIAQDTMKDGEEELLRPFGEKAYFTLEEGIGAFLNSTQLGLVDENYVVSTEYEVGSIDETLGYRLGTSLKQQAYVCLPTLTDMYLGASSKYVLANRVELSEYKNYAIDQNLLVSDLSIDGSAIRPVLSFQPDIKIVSGDGSLQNPYNLEVIAHE